MAAPDPGVVVPCPRCNQHLVACVHAGAEMRVRHWWCPGCGYESRAIGRERMLTVEHVVGEHKYRGRD